MIKKPTVASLFSGAGGLDLGFKNAGFELIWANDFDADAVETYKANIGDECVLGDISEISSEDIPKADVMLGGFPCQGFSVANAKRNVLDERNSLYLEYVRVLKDKKPKVFIAENVKGILSLGKGSVMEGIINDFSEVGYRVQYKLLNAADYGVPQARKRVIIVGIRNDIDFDIDFEYPEPTHAKDGKNGLLPWVSVKEAFVGLPDPDGEDAHTVPNNEYSQYKVTVKNFTGHRKTNPDLPSPTILARGNGGGGVVAIPHYNGKRRMTVRESAAVQSFPKDFAYKGTRGSCYRQVGNAVPVLLAQKIAEQLLIFFEKNETTV